ncbi:hypothetical protein N7471_006297 [Penicillium samsonianum]|uniref:uncharacterized protein n=1 Tax=Penicillium samsonianum TaxID=1882272 RepID=UPI002546FBF9|nr:uncharacterized protein N7471_006297 [Penicillium samsonianum]KAJ6139811.1 hypothetical protein N7471_006297 [Penicillium samsonianum]
MEKVDRYQPTSQNDNTVHVLLAFNTHLPPDGRVNFVPISSLCKQTKKFTIMLSPWSTVCLSQYRTSPRRLLYPHVLAWKTVQSTGPLMREPRLKEDCLKRDGKI